MILQLSTIIFPSFLSSSRNSRKKGSRTLLASYFRELNKAPVLVSNFGNQIKFPFSSRITLLKGNPGQDSERKKEREIERKKER